MQARKVDTGAQTVQCEDIFKGASFEVKYDYLVVATGCKTNAFNNRGRRARGQGSLPQALVPRAQIRSRALECFERASNPTLSSEEVDRLLSFIVVGGGPTSCEFTTSSTFCGTTSRWYPDLAPRIKVTLVEAGPNLLGTDRALVDYYDEPAQEADRRAHRHRGHARRRL